MKSSEILDSTMTTKESKISYYTLSVGAGYDGNDEEILVPETDWTCTRTYDFHLITSETGPLQN